MIRVMVAADLPQVFDICDRVNEQMRFHELGYPYSHNAMARSWPKVISDKNHIALCSENDGKIDGIFLARLQDNSYFSENYLVAYEIAIHADPKLNRITRSRITLQVRNKAEGIMQESGVKSFFLSTHPTKTDGMERNLKRHGYRLMGHYHVKEFNYGLS